jgi:serine/threonine protein kinase
MSDSAYVILPRRPGDQQEAVSLLGTEIRSAEPVVYPRREELTVLTRQQDSQEAVTIREPETRPLLFGRYRVERELGRGGMGVVCLAKDEVLRIPVALKLVPEEVARSEEALEGLRKEVLRGMALTHPGIVRVYSFERDHTGAAIVMEYVEGEPLSDLKARQPGRCFDPERLRPWLEQLCAALDYAHEEARIAHRDLKPSNLILTKEGRLKVADFGIASSLSESTGAVSVRHDSSGTPPYMSPQQAMGERPTVTDDIYSLGATLYELLTGKPPFYRGHIITQVLNEPPDSLKTRRADLGIEGRSEIPPQWERAISACLAKQPADRPPSGAALLKLLDTASYAMVQYSPPRVEIALESLRLEPVPATLHHTDRPVTMDAIELPPDLPQPYLSRVQVLPPQTMVDGLIETVVTEAVSWSRRIGSILAVAGVFLAVLWLVQRFNLLNSGEEEQQKVVVQIPMQQGTVQIPQQMQVEVRYLPPPPGMMPPPPPPQRMPPPPGPGMGPGPRGPR